MKIPSHSVFFSAAAFVLLLGTGFGFSQEDDVVNESLLPTGRLIKPIGESRTFFGRPVDLILDKTDQWVFVKDRNHLRLFSVNSFEQVAETTLPGGASLTGLAMDKNGIVYVSNARNQVYRFAAKLGPDKKPDWAQGIETKPSIKFSGSSFPCGIALNDDLMYVALSKANQVAVVDLKNDKIMHLIDVGVAPFDVLISQDGSRLLVSNIGGRRPAEKDSTAKSAGTDTVIDERGIAATGSVSVIDTKTNKVVKELPVGLHPSALAAIPNSQLAVVANTNHDTVSVINWNKLTTRTFSIKPIREMPFGTMPSDVNVSGDGETLFIANAGNNSISLFDLSDVENSTVYELPLKGMIPTGWYPSAIVQAASTGDLFVANLKGTGSRSIRRDPSKGKNSHDHQGSIQKVGIDLFNKAERLTKLSGQVKVNSRFTQILKSMELSEPGEVAPQPIPVRLGEPSHFKHIIYVIKENRTYDQVFGDFKNARGERALCVFPERVTPNHHALARRFGILDNYYCNGILSADGHSWATEGNVTPYLERAFGGFARSYTFGDDPITYSSTGFIWDKILGAGLSFRNYGEMDYAKPPGDMKYQQIFAAYQAGKEIEFEQNIGIERLRNYSSRNYPGWNMMIPDVLRMDRFIKEFREFEKTGGLPNFSIVYLPQDHLGGGVTSAAHMADNDLALGRLVDVVSHSKFWKETVIFVNEDDPQNGYDHIDGHRSICLAISPYSKPGVNHRFYNQTSALRTMLHIFGLTPLNQQDASAPLMTDCFQATPDFRPYKALEANFPLNQTAQSLDQQSPLERKWRTILATVPIERTGMKTEQDEDNLNRFVWHEQMGWGTPYPVKVSGAHGSGLKKLGLAFESELEKKTESNHPRQ